MVVETGCKVRDYPLSLPPFISHSPTKIRLKHAIDHFPSAIDRFPFLLGYHG